VFLESMFLIKII